mmetsp:Transcript_29639/g.58167  ORF Transcript_29639/g.58167 Transcript_29639/m.58167 type:complete len:99 (+) Transcript_29639:531-827(+)
MHAHARRSQDPSCEVKMVRPPARQRGAISRSACLPAGLSGPIDPSLDLFQVDIQGTSLLSVMYSRNKHDTHANRVRLTHTHTHTHSLTHSHTDVLAHA